MNRRARWLTRLLGPAVLAYFLLSTDLHRIAAHLREVHWAPFVLALALYPGVVIVKAWRWTLLIRELGMPVPTLGRATTVSMIGQFAGGVTPGQTGDFIRAWYLREQGGALSSALFSILLDRLLDFLVLALLSVSGLVAFLRVFPSVLRAPILVSTVGFALATVLVVPALMARRPRAWILEHARWLAPASMQRRMEHWQTGLDALDLRPALMAALLLATVTATAVAMVRLWLLFRALDVVVPGALLVSSVALISILQTLPVTVAGVGVRDVVLVAVLTRYGYTTDRALALSGLFLALVIEQMLVGFVVSMSHPLGAGVPRGPLRPAASADERIP